MSSVLFVYYGKRINTSKEKGFVRGCTNKRVLAQKTGIRYDTLVNIFTRQRNVYYETEDIIILKLYISDITKGSQSLKRRGQAGMKKFAEYVIKGRSDSY